MTTTDLLILFVASCAISASLTWFLVRRKLGFGQDAPDHRKSHTVEVSRLGGLPIFVAIVAGVVALTVRGNLEFAKWWPVYLCNLLIFGLGFIDDIRPLGAKLKLFGQLGAALIAYGLNLSIDIVSIPFGDGSLQLGSLSLPITLIWCVAITNIINLIDGMDGLASGIGMFLCICLGVVGFVAGQHGVALMAILMAGALLGFLFFNFPPAKIYLGDGGAYFLGFFIASVSMTSSNKGTVAAVLLVVMIALGLPILDTAFAIARRGIRGLPLFRADAEHIHHRLIVMGYSKNAALVAMYTICGIFSVIGLSVFLSKGMTLPIAGAAVFLVALFAARYLGYIGDWKNLQKQFKNAMRRRKEVQYAMIHGQLLEVELDRCPDEAKFWEFFKVSMERIGMSTVEKPDYVPLHLRSSSGVRWDFYVPEKYHARTASDWRTLAECLLPVYVMARMKWAPESLQDEESSGGNTLEDANPSRSI